MDTTQPTRSAPHTDAAPVAAPFPKSPNTNTTFDAYTGTVRSHGNVSSDDAPSAPAEDFLANARDKNGTRVARSALNGSALVTISGIEMQLDAAESAGLVSKGANGYQLAETKTQPEAKREAPPVAEAEAFDDAVEEVAATLASSTGQQTQDAIIHEWTAKGEVSQATIARVAEESGASPAQVRYAIDTTLGAFSAQAEKVLVKYGDPAAVAAWARINAKDDFAAAQRHHAQSRSTAQYAKVGAAYMGSLDRTAEGRATILGGNLGNVQAREVNGRIVVTHPTKWAGEITWDSAVKLGHIAPTFGG